MNGDLQRLSRREVIALAGAAAGTAVCPGRSLAADRHVSWLAEIQKQPAVLPADAPRLSDLLVDASRQPITSVEGWVKRREEFRRWWLNFLGPMPAERKSAPKLTVVEEDRVEGVVRQLVRYEIEPGIETEA